MTDLLRLYSPYRVGPSFVPAVPLSDDSQVYFWVPKELVLPGKSIKQAAKRFFWEGGESLVKAFLSESGYGIVIVIASRSLVGQSTGLSQDKQWDGPIIVRTLNKI